jgi:hypothetical protein
MTIQIALVLAGIVSAFMFFGIILAWADFHSSGGRKSESKKNSTAHESHQHLNDERRAA